MSSDTIDKTAGQVEIHVLPYEETDDQAHDRFTHIVNPPNNLHIWREGMSTQDVVDIARAQALPVKALCGYIWVPKYNPEKYPACPTCIEIAGKIIAEMG